jgi:beta-lactamase regulating signal transducer with metallopeptidase domain/Tol biopolymer transport system component
MSQIISDCLMILNRVGNAFYRHAAGVFIQVTVLIIVLFVIDLLLRKRVRSVFRYCLWLLVLVKLVLPPTISLPTGIGYWASGTLPISFEVSDLAEDIDYFGDMPTGLLSEDGLPRETSEIERADNAASPSAPTTHHMPISARITWRTALFLLWLFGVCVFLVLLGRRARYVRDLLAASSPADEGTERLLEQCCRQIGWRRRVGLRLTDAIPSPAVCGFYKPTVLIPVRVLKKLSPERLRSALIHEIAHIKRGDLWVNGLQTLIQVVYFYNPFVWFANAMIRRVCEEAVDETVLVTLGGDAEGYSDTLLDISETVFRRTAMGLRMIGVAESRRSLKRRIKHMLTRPVPQSTKIGAFSTIAIFLVAAILLPMARAERSNQKVSTVDQKTGRPADEMLPAADEGAVIVDPDTGVKYVLAKTLSGANNVIAHVNKLIMSPDARFLVQRARVIPLDGTETFRYIEHSRDVRETAVSPDGRYIAHGANAVWLQPVSPETLRPNGPAKKLMDLHGGRLLGSANRLKALYWTRDSQTVYFSAYDAEGRLERYAFSAATGEPVSYPDATIRTLLSPDGKCMAASDAYSGFRVKPIDGSPRVLCKRATAPICWSRDGHWLIGTHPDGGVRFVSYPEGQEYLITLPEELEKDWSTLCVGPSSDRSKLLFVQAGYKLTQGVKVASADGTALSDVVNNWCHFIRWAPDGKAMLHTQRSKPDLLMTPLSGDSPVQFNIMPTAPERAKPLSVSPDCKWLLFTTAPESGSPTFDVGIIPLSMTDHEARGPAKVLFSTTSPARPNSPRSTWSPDSTAVALLSKDDPTGEQDIWIVFTDGRAPIRLTRTAAIEDDLKWSPDGGMLAFISEDAGVAELKVIPTTGGETVVICKWTDADVPTWGWSPDSKSLTIAEKGMLVHQPLYGGKAEPIVNLKEYGIEGVRWLCWSPDGSRLALEAYRKRDTKEPLASYGEILVVRIGGGHLQQIAATDLGPATWTWDHTWSLDSTRVAYCYEGLVAVRPEGRLYEVAVDDIVERIKAGAIPATQP